MIHFPCFVGPRIPSSPGPIFSLSGIVPTAIGIVPTTIEISASSQTYSFSALPVDDAPRSADVFLATRFADGEPISPVRQDPVKRPLLKTLQPVKARVLEEALRRVIFLAAGSSDDGTIDLAACRHEAFKRGSRAFPSLIDLCRASRDPLRYAAFLARSVEFLLAFLEIAPAYAHGLKSLKIARTSKELKDIWRRVCALVRAPVKNGTDGRQLLNELFSLLGQQAKAARLDPNEGANKRKICTLAAHLLRRHDSTVKALLLETIRLEIKAGRLSPDILDEAKRVAEGLLNVYQLNFYLFCNALGVTPIDESCLSGFSSSFFLGTYPFSINGYTIRKKTGVLIQPCRGGVNNDKAVGHTIETILTPGSKIVTVFLLDKQPDTLNHELWHAFEKRLLRLPGTTDISDLRASQARAIDDEFRAVMGSMAFYNPDGENVRNLRVIRNSQYKDPVWRIATSQIVEAFEGVPESNPDEIRARAREMINDAYVKLVGMSVDDIFDPLRSIDVS